MLELKVYKVVSIFIILSLVSFSCGLRNNSAQTGKSSVVSSGNIVVAEIDGKDLQVNLDPSNSKDTEGISVTAIDLGDSVLLETVDPEGRYLPNTQIIPKESMDGGEVVATQIDSDTDSAIRQIGEINDLEPLKDTLIGTTSFGEVHQLLAQTGFDSGVSVLLPMDGFGADETVNVYNTPAPNTVLVISEEVASNGYKLAAPSQVAPIVFIAIYLIGLATPLIILFTMSGSASAPNVIGWNWAQYQLTEAFHAQGGKNKVYFTYDTENTTCDDEDQLGKVVDQNPKPGVTMNAIDEVVTVYICNEVVEPPTPEPTSTPEPTFTPEPTATLGPQSLTFDGYSVSCFCQQCSCDSDPSFHIELTLQPDGSIQGTFFKYTEFFDNISISGSKSSFGGIIIDNLGQGVTLELIFTMSSDNSTITGKMIFDGNDVSDVYGEREVSLSRSN